MNRLSYRAHEPHYQHPERPNSRKLKIQVGGGRRLKFRKNVNNSGMDKAICITFGGKMHRDHAEITT